MTFRNKLTEVTFHGKITKMLKMNLPTETVFAESTFEETWLLFF